MPYVHRHLHTVIVRRRLRTNSCTPSADLQPGTTHLTRCAAASQLPSCSAIAHADASAARIAANSSPTALMPSTLLLPRKLCRSLSLLELLSSRQCLHDHARL